MIFLYGYSLLYIISGIFAYVLNAFQVLIIAIVCFVLEHFIFKTAKRFWTILSTLAVIFGAGVYSLYRMELLGPVWTMVLDFLKVYWLSIVVTTVSIDTTHQIVMLLTIGLLLMGTLDLFMRHLRGNYIYLLVVSALLVVGGYLSKSMGSLKDREAFLMLSVTMLIYYFYSFYLRHSDFRKKFLPFAATMLLFIVVIIAGSRALYRIDPRPLTREVRQVAYVPSDDIEQESVELDKLNYFRSDQSTVADSFEFDYIEILKIRSEYVNYLKADTFELYYDGEWNRSKDLPNLPGGGDYIHKSDAFEAVDYELFYRVEDTRITLSNFNTNVLLVNNYDVVNTKFYDNIQVINDARRGTYFTNGPLEEGYAYEFEAILPKYGGKAFDDLVRSTSNDPLPEELDQYVTPLTDRYRAIERLAKEITDGIDNKYDQALAIEQYLRSSFTYGEEPPVPPDNVDPIIYFLFESKEGFCQQFATSYALLTKSLGIPTRYVTGFYVGSREVEEEDYLDAQYLDLIEDGVYSVYDYNAHTWPESYFPGVGWIMFEPTPGRYYKTEEIDYNPYDFEGNKLEAEPGLQIVINPVQAWYGLVGIFLLGFFAAVAIISRKRYLLRHETNINKMYAIHGMIRRYFKASGFEKEPAETPREFAERADAYMFDVKGTTFVDLMVEYEEVLYGDKDISKEALEVHIAYLKHLKALMGRRINKIRQWRMTIIGYFTVYMR